MIKLNRDDLETGAYLYISLIRESVNTYGICEVDVDEGQIKGISTYSGLQLEVDWKSQVRRQCDITFRALQILHYSE